MKLAMNVCFSLLHVLAAISLTARGGLAQTPSAKAQIVSLTLSARSVSVLHMRKGYVTSVRLPEDISSVVLGDPSAFKAEHSEAEPQLVFFKPTSGKPAETNALITTRTGHEVSLSLISDSRGNEPVDYVLEYQPARSMIIGSDAPGFVIAETEGLNQPAESGVSESKLVENNVQRLLREQQAQDRHWQGKDLKLSVGKSLYSPSEMTLAFSVRNSSSEAIELLPPQIQLTRQAKKKSAVVKAEQIPVKFFRLTTTNLQPGARADGVVVFERPSFKESQERLFLQIAHAEQVDRPTLAAITFVPQTKGESR
jgi:hypothetical protein